VDDDVILEIHCFITGSDLKVVDPGGWGVVVHQPEAVMEEMVS
jgi:oligoribonuclease (3'-5' exoribonuclease)